jgi:hypothetical protein
MLSFSPEERPVFVREYSTYHYSVLPYFMSRLLIEMLVTAIQLLIICTLIYYMVMFRGSFRMYFFTIYTLAMSSTAIAVTLCVLSRGNAEVAQQMVPVVLLPQLMISGFFVSPALIPPFLRWARYACVLTYSVRILVVEEFYNCSENYFENDNCNLLVKSIEADPDDTDRPILLLSSFGSLFIAGVSQALLLIHDAFRA